MIGLIGGHGFLGKNLADRLKKNNKKFDIFDVIKNNNFPNSKIGSTLDEKKLHQYIKGKKYIYNFSGLSDLNESLNNPKKTVEQNISGTINVLEACRKFKVKKYIHASTIYVSGSQGSFYRCSKKAAEEYILEFGNRYKLNYSIIRFGSLYGPGSDMRNGLYKIISSAIKKGVIEYEGFKDNSREYIHIHDASKACELILDKKFDRKILIASGINPIKIDDITKMISEIINIKKIKFKNKKIVGHYKYSPYILENISVEKLILDSYIDIGQGLLQVARDIKEKSSI